MCAKVSLLDEKNSFTRRFLDVGTQEFYFLMLQDSQRMGQKIGKEMWKWKETR